MLTYTQTRRAFDELRQALEAEGLDGLAEALATIAADASTITRLTNALNDPMNAPKANDTKG